MYGLGLTLLQLGNGRSVQNIYGKGGEVDQQAVEKHVQEFQKNHGQNTLLCSTVKTMVDPEEEKRPDFKTLKSKLPPFSEVQAFIQNQGYSTNYIDVSDKYSKKVLGQTDNYMGDLNTKNSENFGQEGNFMDNDMNYGNNDGENFFMANNPNNQVQVQGGNMTNFSKTNNNVQNTPEQI